MKKTDKKGFTIVELVIVIAVIAILIAVLIPTFSKIIKKANESTDIQAIRNMNMALSVEQVEKKPETIADVAEILEQYNFNLPRKPLQTGYEYYWLSNKNVIVLFNSETKKVEFPEEYKDATFDEDSWFSLDFEPVTIIEIDTADELYGYLHDPNTTGKAKLVANVSSNDITDPDVNRFMVDGVKDLDLNGFTISGKGKKEQSEGLNKAALIFVQSNANLTISDNSSSQEGKIVCLVNECEDAYFADTPSYAIFNNGILTIKSGTYSGGKNVDDYSDMSVDAIVGADGNEQNTIIEGGIFINPHEGGGSNYAVAHCTINGGLFSHKPLGCTYKSGYTISDAKNADGYYYLIEE